MTGFSITERIAEEVSMVMGEMLADIGYELGIFETEIKKMEAWLDEHTVPRATEKEDTSCPICSGDTVFYDCYNCVDCGWQGYLKIPDWSDHPYVKEQEDSMGEVTFTPEEADVALRVFEAWKESVDSRFHLHIMDKIIDAYFNWLDTHTEKPLTFPCPGCGTPLEEMLRNIWECPNEQCPIFRIMASSSNTKDELSEALNARQ